MSGEGVECVGEGELGGQVELVVQGEELEDVRVWSVRADGLPDGDVGVLRDEHQFRGFGRGQCPGEGG
jgi:hypothetical protein